MHTSVYACVCVYVSCVLCPPPLLSQEQFITACVAFLTRKAPSPVGSSADTRTSLSHDIVVTVLSCLQPFLR